MTEPQKNAVRIDQLIKELSNIDSYLAIGSANKRYITCIFEGTVTMANVSLAVRYRNSGANDDSLKFAIPLPVTIGTKKLYIDRIRIGLADADAGDYIDAIKIYSYTTYDTGSYVVNDTTSLTSVGEHDCDFTAIDCSNSKKLWLLIDFVATDALDLDISYVLARYYYDT